MADQIRRYELSSLGFDIVSQVPPSAIVSVGPRSSLITIDLTIDDSVPNAAVDTDECMAEHGWGFVGIIP